MFPFFSPLLYKYTHIRQCINLTCQGPRWFYQTLAAASLTSKSVLHDVPFKLMWYLKLFFFCSFFFQSMSARKAMKHQKKSITLHYKIYQPRRIWFFRLKTAQSTYCCSRRIEKSYFIQQGQLELQITAQRRLVRCQNTAETEFYNKTTILLFMMTVVMRHLDWSAEITRSQ